jgi:hypothetical protein
MPEDAGSLERARFRYFPVVPGKLEFAAEARQAILAARPDVVAVELPLRLHEAYLQAVQRLPQMSVIFYATEQEEEGRAVYAPVDPADPFTEAIRTALEIGAEIMFTDPDVGERPHLPDSYPDTYAVSRIGIDNYVEAYRVYPQERSDEIARHASGIAWKLQGADPSARVFFVVSLNLLDPVLDAMESPQPEPASRPKPTVVQLFNLHPDCLAEVVIEYPLLQERYELLRTQSPTSPVDRGKTQLALLRTAETAYESSTGEKLAYWQRRLLARFTRNLALTAGQLCAGLFDIAVAARSVVDDNFAWEVWDTANRYSFQKPESDLQTLNISGEEVWLDTKKIRLRRRLPSAKRRLRPAGLKPRKKEKVPGEWAKELNGTSICSYPPEDLVIEDYGRFLKKKGKSILSEERTRVEPFTTSILDGIDLRETIRNWHENRIYVRSQQKVSGEVGSVIVIFDEDHEDRYNYCTTWLGEHQNESDMAFYSTLPFDNMVGPGIGRGEYGGFLMSLPARRMFDVWKDPDYDMAETKAERLLLAGLDYSIWKFVVYVAMKPPRSIFRNIATRFGRTIVYIPIGQLSPVTMKKLRVVHVLDGYDKREIAKEYIW